MESVKAIVFPKDILVFPLPKEGEDKVENPATAASEGDDSLLFPLTLTLSPNGEREKVEMSYCLERNLLTHFVKMGILPLSFLLDRNRT